MKPQALAAICISAIVCIFMVMYMSPYHSCVRALVDDGAKTAEAHLYCMKNRN